jgi:hypothetical protein
VEVSVELPGATWGISLAPAISFVDAANRPWHRDDKGVLGSGEVYWLPNPNTSPPTVLVLSEWRKVV